MIVDPGAGIAPPPRIKHAPPSDDSGLAASDNSVMGNDRSRRESPLAVELRRLDFAENEKVEVDTLSSGGASPPPPPSSSASLAEHTLVDASYAESENLMYFKPKLGLFGAPACRWTGAVMALVGMMTGAVLATSGACILVFFVAEEPSVWPLGVTLGAVGAALILIGAIFWTSEFFCDDCLGRARQKIKEAPLKNAIKRRSRMALRAASSTSSQARIIGSRTNSRLSSVSLRTTGVGVTRNEVSMRY